MVSFSQIRRRIAISLWQGIDKRHINLSVGLLHTYNSLARVSFIIAKNRAML